MKALPGKYDHQAVEPGRYQKWLDQQLFAKRRDAPSYCIVLPPPNVTGRLHLGHAWDGTLQDIMIRYKTLAGQNVVWLPGLDHAGVATQTKFEKVLKEAGKPGRADLSREEFVTQLAAWAETQKGLIREQWASLGFALDYQYEKYTMDADAQSFVAKTFVDLYNDGLIYRGDKLVNWDPVLQTAISNIEVIHKSVVGRMYYVVYRSASGLKDLTVATTRPETIFADVCLVVNPTDRRYAKHIGSEVFNPLNGTRMKVIADRYVDKSFGTGVLKCTPGHDFNDYEIGKRHGLPILNVLNPDATLNELAGQWRGLAGAKARNAIGKWLQDQKLLVKVEEHAQSVGHSERTDAVVQPFMSRQWFVRMAPLAQSIIDAQKGKEAVKFFPNRFDGELHRWLAKIEDWCISRQIVWGHRIPAWTDAQTGRMHVGTAPPESPGAWSQSDDVLDTWFSSALWPLTTTRWHLHDRLAETFFPVDLLVTGYDILFFWVSRMMFMSLYLAKKRPFNQVLIHGLIRDDKGRKMSKSLGNGIDPMDVVGKYGADSLRLFLAGSSTAGEDLRYSEPKIKAAWNLLNKLWNATRLLAESNQGNERAEPCDLKALDAAGRWLAARFDATLKQVERGLAIYSFTNAVKALNDFVWDDFCNTYLELQKEKLRAGDPHVVKNALHVLRGTLVMLHPFAPFCTDYLYESLPGLSGSIMLARWPQAFKVPKSPAFAAAIEVLTALRRLRWANNLGPRETIKVCVLNARPAFIKAVAAVLPAAGAVLVQTLDPFAEPVKLPVKKITLLVDLGKALGQEERLAEYQARLVKIDAEVARSERILANADYLAKAPKAKVEADRAKLAAYLAERETIVKAIAEQEKKE